MLALFFCVSELTSCMALLICIAPEAISFMLSVMIRVKSSHNEEVKTALLLVNEAWKGALHIYKKNGFSELRRIEDFFTEDGAKTAGIVMTKAL